MSCSDSMYTALYTERKTSVYNAIYTRPPCRQPVASTLPAPSSSLMRIWYCKRSRRVRIWYCTRYRISHRHAAETEACMPTYTYLRPARLVLSHRAIVSRRPIVSLRYQLVAHPDPLRLSVQPLPAHLVLIEGDAEIVMDILPVDSRNRLQR